MQWNDLQVFLSIARTGTLAGAARDLGVNHSTVFRRLNSFEESLGVRLFERLSSGYALTIAGEEMRATAERVEQELERLDRRITGQDLRLSGSLIVTTTDTIATYLLGPHIAAFRRAYPGISLDLILDNQNVNLSKRQADIAVRPTLTPPETLIGRRLCEVAFAPYVSKTYLSQEHGYPEQFEWVMLDGSLAHLAAAKWLKETHPNVSASMRTNNLQGVLSGVAAGLGPGLLPCFMGDIHPEIERLHGPVENGGSDLWLLTHEDLRHAARVRAFMDFMVESLSSEFDLLEGRSPAPLT